MNNKSDLVSGGLGFFGILFSIESATEIVGLISSILGLIVLSISIIKMIVNGQLNPKRVLKWLFNSLKDRKITKEEIQELIQKEEQEEKEKSNDKDL